MSGTSIFFAPTAEGVDCLIYDGRGSLLARHSMVDLGPRIRLHDFQAAVDEWEWELEKREVLKIVEQPL